MFVLDTNTLIYFFKGEGQVAVNLLSTPPNELIIPTAVVFELEYGIRKSTSPQKRTEQLVSLLSIIATASFDMEEAHKAAEIRARLEAAGTPIGPYDLLIAATALAQRATLVTRRVKEFAHIPELDLVNWY